MKRMSGLCLPVTLVVVLSLIQGVAVGAENTKSGVYEYVSEKPQVSPCGRYRSLKMKLTDPVTGKSQSVSTTEDQKGKYKKGDVLALQLQKGYGGYWIKSIDVYKPTPGEEQPDVYIFDKVVEDEVAGKKRLAVVATKFKTEFKFYLPATASQKTGETTDNEFEKKVRQFKTKDLVEVKGEKTGKTVVLKSIDAHEQKLVSQK